jgi:hypothetical protein
VHRERRDLPSPLPRGSGLSRSFSSPIGRTRARSLSPSIASSNTSRIFPRPPDPAVPSDSSAISPSSSATWMRPRSPRRKADGGLPSPSCSPISSPRSNSSRTRRPISTSPEACPRSR